MDGKRSRKASKISGPNSKTKLGAKVFLIGNEYQTSSMLSFYLKDKGSEGPGHPPVYIPESQDIQNQFSFWPRYDAFVEADPSAQRDTTFTEEAGVNPFIDRTALYVTDRPEASPPQNLQSAFTRWELLAVFELERHDLPTSTNSGLCAVINTRLYRCDDAPSFGHYPGLQRGRQCRSVADRA